MPPSPYKPIVSDINLQNYMLMNIHFNYNLMSERNSFKTGLTNESEKTTQQMELKLVFTKISTLSPSCRGNVHNKLERDSHN